MSRLTAPISEPLFDADFLDQVSRLRIVARQVARGGRWAEQRSRDQGSGLEFRDYRPYAPGDPLRSIDWNIYRRLGRVFLRLFEELEDLPVYLLPDVSGSMWFESPPRARAGLRAALAFAAISLGQHDSVGLFPFADALRVEVRPQAGRSRVLAFAGHLQRLADAGAEGATDLTAALERFRSLRLRQGLVVVVSDFFDPAGLAPVLDQLRRLRHRLVLVPLVRASDREPSLRGDVRLRDCETGTATDVSVTPAVLERYRAAHDRFHESLAQFARKRGAGLLTLDVDRPVVPQLAHVFEAGRLSV